MTPPRRNCLAGEVYACKRKSMSTCNAKFGSFSLSGRPLILKHPQTKTQNAKHTNSVLCYGKITPPLKPAVLSAQYFHRFELKAHRSNYKCDAELSQGPRQNTGPELCNTVVAGSMQKVLAELCLPLNAAVRGRVVCLAQPMQDSKHSQLQMELRC